MQLLFTFLRLPPWCYLLLAAAAVALGIFDQSATAGREAEKVTALEAGMPELVTLDDLNAGNLAPYNEVFIAAQINTALNYTLRKGSESSTPYYMMVLVGTESTGEDQVVRAAIVVPERELDAVTTWMTEQIRDVGPLGPVFHLNGRHVTSTSHDDVAEDALTNEEGLRLAPDFFYLDPWFAGREVALAPRSGDGSGLQQLLNMIAFFLVAIAGIKFLLRRNRRAGAA